MHDRVCHAKEWFRVFLTICILLVLLSAPGNSTVAQSVSIPLIEAGDAESETPSLRAVAFSQGWKFHRHWLNDMGTVVFSGSDDLSPGSYTDDSLVMVGSQGFVKFVSRGDPVPGKEGQLFTYLGSQFQELSLNDRDEAAFFAMFRPCASRELLRQCSQQPGNPPAGLFLYTGGGVRKIVTLGEVSPSDASLVFGELSYPLLNDRGEVLFRATLVFPDRPFGPGQLGIFRFRNGRLEKIVVAGDPTPLGDFFRFDMRDPRFGFSLWRGVLAMDRNGTILFSDRTSAGTDALFRYADNQRTVTNTCGYVSQAVSTNIEGDALLGLSGSNTCPENGYYRWDRSGVLEWITSPARMPAPGGGTFTSIYIGEYPQPGGSGAILFMNGVQGGSTQGGYFQYQAGSIRKLVVSNDPAPVYSGGDFEIFREEKYGDYTLVIPPSTRFSTNESNMLAFTSEITGTPRLFGLFLFADESVSRIALLGDRAPQTTNQTFETLPTGWSGGGGAYDSEDRIRLNNSGEMLFRSRLCCGPWDQGLFMASMFHLEVPNGSFESDGGGNYPAGWSTAWSNSGTGQVTRFEGGADSSFRGTSCLRLHVAPGGGSTFVLSDPIAVNSEATYLVSSRLRYNLSNTSDRVYFTALQYDGQGNELGLDELQGKKGDNLWNWQTQRINIRTRKDTAFIRIRFGLKSTDAADLDVDAVR
jgi:hypothetical protein